MLWIPKEYFPKWLFCSSSLSEFSSSIIASHHLITLRIKGIDFNNLLVKFCPWFQRNFLSTFSPSSFRCSNYPGLFTNIFTWNVPWKKKNIFFLEISFELQCNFLQNVLYGQSTSGCNNMHKFLFTDKESINFILYYSNWH